MGLTSLKQQIEKNTINAHVPQIATIRVQKLFILLADYVCIQKNKLEKQLDVLMESLEPLTIGDRESFRAFKNKLLEETK